LGAISSHPLYLFLAKGARKRMPLLSGLGVLGLLEDTLQKSTNNHKKKPTERRTD